MQEEHDEHDEPKIHFHRCPKFERYELTEDQMERLASKAARKALALGKAELKQELGESTIAFGATVIRRFFYVVGAISLAIFAKSHPEWHVTDLFK